MEGPPLPSEVDGTLDPAFGEDGRLTTDFVSGVDRFDLASGPASPPDHKIVAAGHERRGRFALARSVG